MDLFFEDLGAAMQEEIIDETMQRIAQEEYGAGSLQDLNEADLEAVKEKAMDNINRGNYRFHHPDY